ncbi:hypothetical protein Tco_0336856 [Tanacetum coccineum]
MANFPRLDALAVPANSRGLFEGMQLFITELEGLCPSAKRYKILECLNKDQKQDLIQLLELRKVILGKYQQVSRKIALIEKIRSL